MPDVVFDFLKNYGLTNEEIYSFQDTNEKMFFTNLDEVKKNIDFLVKKGLSKEEIISIIKENPFMLTVKDNRLDALDNIYYKELNFYDTDIKNLIKVNPDIYIVSPVELQKTIDNLKEKMSNNSIRDLFINNPKIINLEFKEFEDIINDVEGM